MKRLSIIIPMYKVEPYVARCLQSLEDQDIPRDDYEIICINDGSPDNCGEVVSGFQKKYDNIILIDQENQGVSRARNNGIDKATGRYLIFIDPDDYVGTNTFGEALKVTEEKNAQATFLGFAILNKEGSIRKKFLYDENIDKIYNGLDAYFHARGDGFDDPDRTWGIIFEKDFIVENRLYYLRNVPYLEDGEYIARVLCLARRCVFINKIFYFRTSRPGSATNSRLFSSKNAINGFIKAALNLRDFKDTLQSQEQKEFINQPIVKFVVLSIASSTSIFHFRMFLETYSILRKNNFKKLELKGCNSYYLRLGYLYNASGFILYCYYLIKYLVFFLRKVSSRIFNIMKFRK